MDQARDPPIQWETLHDNDVSQWLGAYLDWSLKVAVWIRELNHVQDIVTFWKQWYEINKHYNDVMKSAMASQLTSHTIVYLTVCSGADERKHQSSASLVFVWGIFDDVIMIAIYEGLLYYRICSRLSKLAIRNFCSSNGLASTRGQAVTWTNDDLVHWLIYAPSCLNELHWNR